MSTLDDATLIRRTLGGDPRSFAPLVLRYDRKVRRLVGRALRDSAAVEDVVQETFYLAFRNLAQIGECERFEGWLLRIAQNRLTEHLRQRSRRRLLALSAETEPAQVSASEWVWDEVQRLTPAFRDVLTLRYREGRSYKDIAARLDVPISTVRGRIYEARRALKKRLCDEGDPS